MKILSLTVSHATKRFAKNYQAYRSGRNPVKEKERSNIRKADTKLTQRAKVFSKCYLGNQSKFFGCTKRMYSLPQGETSDKIEN
jgi:hypothetical protein